MARKIYECKNHIIESCREYLTEDYSGRTKERKIHRGMDFVKLTVLGTCTTDWVTAIEKGQVAIINKNSSIGNYIYIKHESGLYSVYYHLKDGTNKVKIGDIVEKGQRIAYMGNTGNSTGAHIHFGILTNTNGTSDIDPRPYLLGEKSLLKSVEEVIDELYYKIKKGDNLTKIAKMYGTTVNKLLELNPKIKNKNLIYAGDTIRVK